VPSVVVEGGATVHGGDDKKKREGQHSQLRLNQRNIEPLRGGRRVRRI
jgi:hypothetical protein